MNANKLNKKIIIVFLIIIAFGAVWYYFHRPGKGKIGNVAQNNRDFFLTNSTFKLTDDLNRIVFKVKPKIDEADRIGWEKKIQEYNNQFKSLKIAEDQAANYSNIAALKRILGEYEDSLYLYIRSLEKDSKYRPIWLALGGLLVDMRAYNSADSAYRQSIKINILAPEGYIGLANLYNLADNKNKDKAGAAFNDGLKNNPYDPSLLDAFAGYLTENGDNKKAIEILNILKEVQPANKTAIEKRINALKNK